jgi:hypothetical protein
MPKHEVGDVYWLQVLVNGNWHDDMQLTAGKLGAAQRTRRAAKETKNPHRVVNRTRGNTVYVQADPQ